VRQLPLPAPRGEIVDSTGKVLVKNTSHVLAEVNPAGLATRVVCTTFPADQRAKCNAVVAATPPGAVPRCAALKGQTRCLVLARLGKVLGMKTHEVWRAYEKTLYVNADGSGGCTPKPHAPCYVVNAGPPIPLKPASEPEVAYVLERRSQFPGVQFLQTTQRQYPYGDLAPNVLGYVSQISQSELKDSNFAGPHRRRHGRPGRRRVQLRPGAARHRRPARAELRRNRPRGRPDVRAARRPARRHAAADRSTRGCRRSPRRRSPTASRSPTTTAR
jgi:cell division protein FtsI/penicillin-binding protein 2